MHVKVDEDLPTALLEMLRKRGYQATSVVEQGMGGWQAAALWQAVQAKAQFLVTADKGFADARYHAPGTHAGVLLLRPDQDGIRPLVELGERVLAHYDLQALASAITVVTPRGVRIRRAGPP